jgi:hypothetical protein
MSGMQAGHVGLHRHDGDEPGMMLSLSAAVITDHDSRNVVGASSRLNGRLKLASLFVLRVE